MRDREPACRQRGIPGEGGAVRLGARNGTERCHSESLTTEKRLFSDARLVITTVARVATALVG